MRDLGQLDGDVEGEGDDDLEDDDERPEGEEAGPKGFKLVEGEKAMKGSEGGERVELRPQPVAPRRQSVKSIKTHQTTSKLICLSNLLLLYLGPPLFSIALDSWPA